MKNVRIVAMDGRNEDGRDSYMADQIKKIRDSDPTSKILVFVGGLHTIRQGLGAAEYGEFNGIRSYLDGRFDAFSIYLQVWAAKCCFRRIMWKLRERSTRIHLLAIPSVPIELASSGLDFLSLDEAEDYTLGDLFEAVVDL